MIDFTKFRYHPVIKMPVDYEVYDFTQGYDPNRVRRSDYGVGKYNEKRVAMYTADLFGGNRDIHMGIDLAAPEGTEVFCFFDGEVFLFQNNTAPGDYGPTIVTRHFLGADELFALWGHLSTASLESLYVGKKIYAGEVIAHVGGSHENGGWNPHLHFQLSLERPERADLPGVVNERDRELALKIYPDPRLVLGALYES